MNTILVENTPVNSQFDISIEDTYFRIRSIEIITLIKEFSGITRDGKTMKKT